VLKAAIRAQLEKMIQLNRTRADFAEKFEALIESYNAGSRSIEELFAELVKLSNSLNDEQERHVRENMSEEELVIFDILTRPAPELSARTRRGEEGCARTAGAAQGAAGAQLAAEIRARSQLKLTIEDTLDNGLPRAYTPSSTIQKCSAVFEHVYESYPDVCLSYCCSRRRSPNSKTVMTCRDRGTPDDTAKNQSSGLPRRLRLLAMTVGGRCFRKSHQECSATPGGAARSRSRSIPPDQCSCR
jgi:hypothetical protein